jgi:hypothetical protein
MSSGGIMMKAPVFSPPSLTKNYITKASKPHVEIYLNEKNKYQNYCKKVVPKIQPKGILKRNSM